MKMKLNCRGGKVRSAIWLTAFCVCIFCSWMVWENTSTSYRQIEMEQSFEPGEDIYELIPGGELEQQFTAQGKSAGGMFNLYLQLLREPDAQGSVRICLSRKNAEDAVLETNLEVSQLPEKEKYVAAEKNASEDKTEGWTALADDSFFCLLKSGEEYTLKIVNESETDSVYLLGEHTVQSGNLLCDGQQLPGFLNLRFLRESMYRPSVLLVLLILVTDATVLVGLWLVLFTDVKTEVLYLVLAIGFGIVTLFDLTPIYGFDMRFQFDSTYVLSNRILGIEDVVYTPSLADPEVMKLSYYRRACDDYSQYQYYYHDEVSANYTDMKAGLRYPFVSAEEQELELVETHLGFIETQLWLCLPQAIGFSVARLMGVGMYPMLQAGRIMAYAVFVLCTVLAIRAIPFGKRFMMVLGLMPAVLVQTVSITRDGTIISLSFLLIALVLRLHFSEKKPGWCQWIPVLVLSIMLAPCKMVYLPVSCLCVMAAYKHYILPAGKRSKQMSAIVLAMFAAAVGVFAAKFFGTIRTILFAESVSLYNTPAYSVGIMLEDPMHTLYVFGNTLRNQSGSLLVNAVQLFDIQLGSSEGITLIIFGLLLLECFCVDTECSLHWAERAFMLLVATGTFLLLVLAAFRWTPLEMDVFIGLQGRYLIPIFPLLLAFYNNKMVWVNQDAAIITKIGCCVFPAISLMNMYLWTITR